jgi:HEAT repeat protein
MSNKRDNMNTQDLSDEILLEDVTGLRVLPASDRASKIADLGRRVARGACDNLVIERMAEVASRESDLDVRKAWLGYFSASGDEAFLAILEAWFSDADEERRVGVVGVLAWNKSPQTNEVLLRLIRSDESQLVRQLALKYLVRRGSLGKWQPCDLLSIVPESDWRPVTKKEYLKLIGRSPDESPLGYAITLGKP